MCPEDAAFAGQGRDAGSGWYRLRARQYDPKVGRFVSPDPSGYAGGGNRYAYANNNPLRWVDLSGLDPTDPATGRPAEEEQAGYGQVRLPGTQVLDGEPPRSGKVYRGLAPGEAEAIEEGRGLQARAPGASRRITQHVFGNRQTQYISTSKDLRVVVRRFARYGVAEIDLSKVTSEIVDISNGIPGVSPRARVNWYAINAREVLIQNYIPPEAITLIR